MLTSTFLPTGPCDPPEKVPYPTAAQEDSVEAELVVPDAVPLLARALPPTIAQEEGVGGFPLANGKLMLNFVPLRTKVLNLYSSGWTQYNLLTRFD